MAMVATGGARDKPRAITSSEAEQLAMSRFTAFEASPLTVTLKIDDGTDSYTVRGLVDYRAHRAVGAYVAGGTGQKQQRGLVAWDSSGLAVALGSGGTSPSSTTMQIARAAAKVGDRNWSPRAYAAYPLDTALHVVVALGADRPDNAQLLFQFGARRLGENTLRGKTYTRFSGPRPRSAGAPPQHVPSSSPLTYWVDGDGNLGRLEIKGADMKRPVTVDFLGHEAHAKVPTGPWQGLSQHGR
ncbi:hypothetical protein [Streptomyces sp. AK02-04a]|uniref:hypothetical protein n=1 Tax=Streptomyces sp. AK02-04a TaxID=3028649 RepID=UPI0029AF7386|nr:hypothetical protein [Streptomyces sp. AK02-04a]MDX3763602.1 hypothetical protein [Streptomyces sp. AK02-04a]